MSLATRCTNCSTVFRVVQDQLLVSEGWVRCGRCREVFNAIENMFDLKKEVPSSQLPLDGDQDTSASQPLGPGRGPSSSREADPGASASENPDSGQPSSWGEGASRNPWLNDPDKPPVRTSLWPASEPSARQPRKRRGKSSALRDDADFEMSELTLDVPMGGSDFPSEQDIDHLLVSNSRDTTFEAYETMPEFMARAKNESRWRHPRVRLALRIAAVLLSFGLLLQSAMVARDTVAAHWPATEPALQALCLPFGCRVEAPRRLNALKVESTTFSETGTGGLYRLAVVLHNREDVRVKIPALDVKLLGARGETLSRRVITAQELGGKDTAIEPAREITLQGIIRVAGGTVSGYDVTAFYP